MKWVVAKFMDGKDYSVLPINWLVETNKENLATSTIKFCKWPPVRSVNSDDLQKAAKPEESWIQYQIKVLGGNKTYSKKKKCIKLIKLKINLYMSKKNYLFKKRIEYTHN